MIPRVGAESGRWSLRGLAAVLLALLGSFAATGVIGAELPAPIQEDTYKSQSIVTEYNVLIPMRDGVRLSADIYRPKSSGPVPVVLIRTCYGKGSPGVVAEARWWTHNGYAFVAEDVRGRGDSDGVFYPLVHEATDGFDTLAWIGVRPWSSGSVGMIGGSYSGWTEVYAAGERSRYLKAIIPTLTPPDPDRRFPMQFGISALFPIYWLASIDGHALQDVSTVNVGQLSRELPLLTLDARMGRRLPAWRDWVSHPVHDAYWKAQSYEQKLLGANVPALWVTGWYDVVQVGATENFINLTSRVLDPQARGTQRLLIGPWEHGGNFTESRKLGSVDFGPDAAVDLHAVELRWFDHWLKGIDNGVDSEPPVRLFVMGENRWITAKHWPMARTRYVKYYLHAGGHANTRLGGGRLTEGAPGAEPADHFRYDPSNPVPSLNFLDTSAGQIRNTGPGPDDYRDVEARSDVLVYTSAPVLDPLMICGPLRAKLFARTSARDTDWTARVLDVWPSGFAERLYEGIVRGRFRQGNSKEVLLTPGKVYDYDINMGSTCITLLKGHRVRLEISSSAFPLFDRNLNTGDALATEARAVVAEQTVLHDKRHASYLLLPVVHARD